MIISLINRSGIATDEEVQTVARASTGKSKAPSRRGGVLARAYGGVTLPSFDVNPVGYAGFFDPATGKHDTWSPPEELQRR